MSRPALLLSFGLWLLILGVTKALTGWPSDWVLMVALGIVVVAIAVLFWPDGEDRRVGMAIPGPVERVILDVPDPHPTFGRVDVVAYRLVPVGPEGSRAEAWYVVGTPSERPVPPGAPSPWDDGIPVGMVIVPAGGCEHGFHVQPTTNPSRVWQHSASPGALSVEVEVPVYRGGEQ